MDDARALAALDEIDIRKVRANWAHARDKGDWELLRGCFHPDATACLSWYNGPAEGFVEGSKRMLHTGKDYAGAHMIASSRVKVRGDRAILESDVQYFLRDLLQQGVDLIGRKLEVGVLLEKLNHAAPVLEGKRGVL